MFLCWSKNQLLSDFFFFCFGWIDPFKKFVSFKACLKQFPFLFCHCPWRGCLKVDTISLQNPSPHQNLWYWSLQVPLRNCQQSEYISIAVFLNFGVNINLWTWSIRKCHTRLCIHFCIVLLLNPLINIWHISWFVKNFTLSPSPGYFKTNIRFFWGSFPPYLAKAFVFSIQKLKKYDKEETKYMLLYALSVGVV